MNTNWQQWVAIGTAALLLFAAALGGAVWLRPQTVQVLTSADAEHSLSTTGEAVLQVKPDTAKATLGINLKAADAKTVQAQANQRLKGIITALKGQGIAEDKIRTLNFNLQPEYRYDSSGAHLDGYRVYSTVEVTTANLDGIGALIDAAIAAGANQVENVAFTLKDRDQYKQQAIDSALADARRKADAAAAKLGTQITGVRHVVVNEGSGSPPPILYDKRLAQGEATTPAPAGGTPVLPGNFDFRVTVQVEFSLK